MGCQARQAMIDDITKRAIKQLRKDNPDMKGPELKAKSIEAANKIVDKSKDLATQEIFSAQEMTPAIRDNASQAIPLPKAKQPLVTISNEVAALDKQFTDNPSNENYAKLLNSEIAHGYRNAKGESLVRLTRAKTVGSSPVEPKSDSAFEDYYIDDDGTMSKSANLDKAFIELDKTNLGENFDEAHSKSLSSVLSMMAGIVKEFQDKEVRLKKSTFENVMEAEGYYDTRTGDIEVRLDTHGPAAEFRNEFSMTNQEVFVHEQVHAVMDFMMDPKNINVAKDPKMQAMIADLKSLYSKAAKESNWQTLLPGIKEGVQYSDFQQEQAKAKWDYVFKNKWDNGLHEFIAGIMTNSMFSEGMNSLEVTDTEKVKDTASLVDKVHAWFANLAGKIFGYATNKRDNSISKAGATLIFDIIRANNNAVERATGEQLIESVTNGFDKVQDQVEIANETVRKITDPFLGAIDAVEGAILNEGKVLDKDGIDEFKKLNTKLQKLMAGVNKEDNTGNKLVVVLKNTFDMLDNIQRFIRAMPTIYKMRQLTAGHPRSKSVAKHYANTMNKLLESVKLYEDGAPRSIGRDFLDRPGMYNFLADSILKLTQKVDNVREKTYENVLAETKDWFGEVHINNNVLNIRHNEALTDVVLRADIQSLDLTAKELQELLREPNKVSKKIKELSKGLSKQQLADVESLAQYMVTSVGTGSNAKNIARGFGGKENTDWTNEDVTQIDQLVSYRALELVEDSAKQTMLDFMDGEKYIDYSTTWGNKAKNLVGFTGDKPLTKAQYIKQVNEGVDKFILHSVGLQEASRQEMRGREYQALKGYMKETYNSDYEVEFHPMRDKQQLINDGYKFIREVKKVPGSTAQYGMFISNEPIIKRANGALGLQDRKHRGFTLRDMVANESIESTESFDAPKRSKEFNNILKSMIAKYKVNRNAVGMHPMYDESGNIVNFRITMSIADKKKYLEMETGGTHNLARSYSTMGAATATAAHNESIVDELHKDYLDNYNDNKEKYVTIEATPMMAADFGLENTRPAGQTKYEKMWARLPSDTKQYAEEVFGTRKIVIRKDLLTIAFGEDDYSISQSKLFDKTSARTKATVKKIERVWQDTMQIAKANIVIKTPEVLMGNVWSNFKILLYIGVNPSTGAKLMLTGAKELKRYEADKKELSKLERDKKSGIKVNEVRIRELTKDVAENSVAPLIEAGLYQSIVEDVSTANDSNRVSQWFNDKTDKYISNETVNSAVQLLFVTQRTKPYQQLLKATQVSDFYFRYAQYYDAVQNKGHSEEKAMRNAIDNYINYEAPLEKHVRYGDAMGTWFFVKYFTRIQKVIKKFVKENPLRVGADVAIQTFITGDTADVLDASMLDKGLSTYNPLKIFERLWEVASPSAPEIINNYT